MAKPERAVWHPAEWQPEDVRAVQALALYAMGAERPWPAGEEPPAPSPADVRRALDWIIHGAAQSYDNGFVAEDPHGRIGAFIDGRQSVGQQLVKLMRLSPKVFEKSARDA
jgi:hypothetical protein